MVPRIHQVLRTHISVTLRKVYSQAFDSPLFFSNAKESCAHLCSKDKENKVYHK
jgi:hypothetical protein